MADPEKMSISEKTLEDGGLGELLSRSLTTRSNDSLRSDYDDGIMRVTSLEDPSRNDTALEATRTLSLSKTKSLIVRTRTSRTSRTTRTTKDLESVLGTDFEVRWNGPDDKENPMLWSMGKKAFILITVSFQTLMVVFYSTSYVQGSAGMMEEFGISSQMKITAGLSTYMLGLACGPLVLAPMSELYGRRIIYIISMFLFLLFVIPACVAKNFTTILVVRFFGGFTGSVTISNAPGSIGDIVREEWRTLAFSLFCIAPMNGPVLGPVIGGFVYENLGWRWTNWIILIFAGVMNIIGLFLPETYSPVLLRHRAAKLRKESGDERYMSRFCYKDGEGDVLELIKVSLKRPLKMLFTEPICIFWAIYIAVVYGILYLSFTAYPVVFRELRGWSAGISGLAFLGIGIGTMFGICCDPISRKIYNMHAIEPETGKRPPEARIVLVCVAAVLIPSSELWFAWTCYPTSIPFIVSILSGVPYGAANTFVFLHGNNYLVTSYDIYAASAMAGNAVSRSIMGGLLPLFGPTMYHNMGPNWAATTVGLIALVLSPIPFVFYKWGHVIRKRSPMLQKLQRERIERGE